MEIKINCLRNGIEGGGASNGPATLLDGYGTYLYDLYKPSDEDVVAHPELADEPLGIVFPTGNLIETGLYSYKWEDEDSSYEDTFIDLRQLRGIFMPHMWRYIAAEGKKDPDTFDFRATLKDYLQTQGQFQINTCLISCGIYCAGKRKTDLTIKETNHICPTFPTADIDNIFLSSVHSLSTDLWSSLHKYENPKIDIWQEDPNTTGTCIYDMPMFIFIKPSSDLWIKTQEIYDGFFSAEELSKINDADIEYYKKGAVLIYKKDLMDFKNFFKKMMGYADEINAYTEAVINSLQNPQS